MFFRYFALRHNTKIIHVYLVVLFWTGSAPNLTFCSFTTSFIWNKHSSEKEFSVDMHSIYLGVMCSALEIPSIFTYQLQARLNGERQSRKYTRIAGISIRSGRKTTNTWNLNLASSKIYHIFLFNLDQAHLSYERYAYRWHLNYIYAQIPPFLDFLK